MTPPGTIALSAEQRRIVRAILGAILPSSATVWAYGSRATGRAGRFSDLDLAIDAGRPLSVDETARLREAFTESDLPFRVDLLDWQTVDENFRRTIALDRITLTPSAVAGGGLTPAAACPDPP